MVIVTVNPWANDDSPPADPPVDPLDPEKQSLPPKGEKVDMFGFQDLASDYFQVHSYFGERVQFLKTL